MQRKSDTFVRNFPKIILELLFSLRTYVHDYALEFICICSIFCKDHFLFTVTPEICINSMHFLLRNDMKENYVFSNYKKKYATNIQWVSCKSSVCMITLSCQIEIRFDNSCQCLYGKKWNNCQKSVSFSVITFD